MRIAPLKTRPWRTAVGLAAAVLLVSGCTGQGGQAGPPEAAPSGTGSSSSPAADEQLSEGPDAQHSAPPDAQESVPPGDPGVDAPSAPDPGAGSAGPELGGARRQVPPSALLTAKTVRTTVGGSWARHGEGGDECVIPEGAVGLSSVSYGSAGGLLVETVATYPSQSAADSAVSAMGEMASDCGWRRAPDPRLGSASVAAKDSSRSLVAVSTEGVVVMLIGSGKVARDNGGWASLVDLAVGTSCPATTEGCH